MNFATDNFLFIFLPITLATYWAAHCFRFPGAASSVLTITSLFFIGFDNYLNVVWLIISICSNYGFGLWITSAASVRRNSPLIWVITFNLLFLFIFKYLNSFSNNVLEFDTSIVVMIGISYFTFQQLSYLLQLKDNQFKHISFLSYFRFICFFPYLTAGPIVRLDEVKYALEQKSAPSGIIVNLGMALFSFGLAKKVLIADNFAPMVNAIFAAPATELSLADSWGGALGFTFQVYFDLSGYADMALGLALLVGVRLPINFYSPLKATNINEFWGRWHMTMTRFFTDYVFNTLALNFTRYALLNRIGPVQTFIITLFIPMLVTFLLVALWHDSTSTFLLFGLLHGLALTTFHLFRKITHIKMPSILGWLCCFIFFIFTVVLFRAPNLSSALTVWSAMLGGTFFNLPPQIAHAFGIFQNFELFGLTVRLTQAFTVEALFGFKLVSFIVIALVICLGFPNTYQIFERYRSAITPKRLTLKPALSRSYSWRPNAAWMALSGFMFAFSVLKIISVAPTQFVYWQF